VCDVLYCTFLTHYLAPSLHALSSPTRLVVSFGSLPQLGALAPFFAVCYARHRSPCGCDVDPFGVRRVCRWRVSQ